MLDELPSRPRRRKECAIINLNKSNESGSHWVATYYNKDKNQCLYFDSFGNLRPPKEIVKYLGEGVQYNYDRYQSDNTVICGHLCLLFLYHCTYKSGDLK